MNLSTSISELNRVGKTTARSLHRLGIYKVRDLLYWFPFRYEDFRRLVPIGDLHPGELVTIKGKIELLGNKRSWKRRTNITEGLVTDDTGSVRVVWFNQPFIAKNLKPGDVVFLSGKVRSDMLGAQLVSPTYEKADKETTAHTARLVPIYPTTSGITQKQLRFLIAQVIDLVKDIPEWLPDEILEGSDLVPMGDALHGIHFPVDEKDLHAATARLKFDELFLIQLQAERARAQIKIQPAPPLKFFENEIKDFVAHLPFALTKTQKISAWEILQDLSKPHPMNRLLSGDVGSGKTVVAALALYDAVLNGYQAVFMAPTEILAMQHFQTLNKLLADKMAIGLLSQSQQLTPLADLSNLSPAKSRQEWREQIKNGKLQIIVGTHALLSDEVKFRKLGLVIVDEQHRFGVDQRKVIKEKGEGAHFLSMTATPIPRSLALTLYGDLELSIINELPPGRKKILTRLVEPSKRMAAYDFIRQQVRGGRQVFVICPLIEPAEKETTGDEFVPINYFTPDTEKKSVMSEYKKLSQKVFPDLKVEFLHGKLKGSDKEAIMAKFKAGQIDILVSTSVIEVGVDVPNASVMMIEGADRFGLAQLHQFRGRVGRSVHQSYCILFTDSNSKTALERLKFFEANHDGFKLAEKDLEMRGPGEVYGTTQSGLMNLRIATLADKDIIKIARSAAKLIIENLAKFPRLVKKIREWEESVHLE